MYINIELTECRKIFTNKLVAIEPTTHIEVDVGENWDLEALREAQNRINTVIAHELNIALLKSTDEK